MTTSNTSDDFKKLLEKKDQKIQQLLKKNEELTKQLLEKSQEITNLKSQLETQQVCKMKEYAERRKESLRKVEEEYLAKHPNADLVNHNIDPSQGYDEV